MFIRPIEDWIAIAIVTVLALLLCVIASASEVIDSQRMADAIYQAEGGANAVVPYGILSVKVSSEHEARRVCINTINNNMARWQWARQNGDDRDFISFLGDRYCPLGASNDPKGLNSHWKNNVRRAYGKPKDSE